MSKEQIKKAGNIVGNVLSFIFIGLTIVILIISIININNKDKMTIFGYQVGIVGSDSMEPTIDVYDFILHKDVDFGSIEKDDIIVFRYIGSDERLKGQQIVHRVYGFTDDGKIITKGDNPKADVDDEYVTEDNFIGKCVFYTSLFGIAKLRQKGVTPIFMILTLVFVVIIISSIVTIFKEIQKAKIEEVKKKVIEEYEANKEQKE